MKHLAGDQKLAAAGVLPTLCCSPWGGGGGELGSQSLPFESVNWESKLGTAGETYKL